MYNYFIITFEDTRNHKTIIEGYGSFESYLISWKKCTEYAIQKLHNMSKYHIIKSIEYYTRGQYNAHKQFTN